NKEFIVGPNGQKIGEEYDSIKVFNINEEKTGLIVIGSIDQTLIKQTIGVDEKVMENKEEEKEHKLSKEEQERLDLLNLIHKPNLEDIDKYLSEHKKDGDKSSVSKSQVNILNEALRQNKELLLDIVPAKKDRLVEQTASRLVYKLFPEVLENIKREEQKNKHALSGFWNRLGFGGGGGNSQESEEGGSAAGGNNLESRSTANTYEGGGFGEKKKKEQEVFELRESILAMMANNIFTKYSDSGWSKQEIKLSKEIDLPFKEITNTLKNVGNSLNISLPKPVEARIILERVKGIKEDGTEINLEVQTNAMQEVVCVNSENVKEIIYSFKMSEAFEPLKDQDQRQYSDFVKKLDHSSSLTESIADLPEELTIFINSLKNKKPKEKIIAIENFVKENSYYDFSNQETIDLKKGKNITEIIDIMELRAQELEGKGENNNKKKYAGVCADFALLTTALLREASIASGYLKGYKVDGKKASTNNAHGCSFVLYPNENGESRMIAIDGTPDGIDSGLGDISLPSISEREKEFEKISEEKKEEALKDIEEIEKDIEKLSEAELNNLSNGRLEEALNKLLKYNVNENNLKKVEKILQAYWYSPLHKEDLSDIETNLKATAFIKNELEAVDGKSLDSYFAKYGSQLFNVIEDFLTRFKKGSDRKDIKAGFEVLDKVYQLSASNLSEIERKALSTSINYLKAKNIKRQNGK
ncbi:MAG: transglutaminase-like domain-containing protein, partial [Parcubacteria group bacterium]